MKVKGKRWLVKRALVFARALGLNRFTLRIVRDDKKSSWCQLQEDGSFVINIDPDQDKYWATVHLAHEMVHLKQYKRDELVWTNQYHLWKGQKFLNSEYLSDEYFFEPWEMEARALEDWLMHKWRNR